MTSPNPPMLTNGTVLSVERDARSHADGRYKVDRTMVCWYHDGKEYRLALETPRGWSIYMGNTPPGSYAREGVARNFVIAASVPNTLAVLRDYNALCYNIAHSGRASAKHFRRWGRR
jgi:hypothetical protein